MRHLRKTEPTELIGEYSLSDVYTVIHCGENRHEIGAKTSEHGAKTSEHGANRLGDRGCGLKTRCVHDSLSLMRVACWRRERMNLKSP